MNFLFVFLVSFLISLTILSPILVINWLENKRINAERKEIEAEIEALKNKVYDFTPPKYIESPLTAFLKAIDISKTK